MRIDGRENNQLRDIKFTHNFTKHALGSVLVEFGDTNGLFKSEEDFFKVANVKEHFIPKIKAMIKFGNKPTPKNDDDNDEGRIIDF